MVYLHKNPNKCLKYVSNMEYVYFKNPYQFKDTLLWIFVKNVYL